MDQSSAVRALPDALHASPASPALSRDALAGTSPTTADTPTTWTLEADGFSATVDAFAWERDPDAPTPRMRLWFVSLLGPQQSLRALWVRLVRGDVATMRALGPGALGQVRFCGLAPEGPRRWRFLSASLPASAGHHGVLVPDAARYASDRADFLLLPRRDDEAAALHYRFLMRRLDLPLHPAWATWLWDRALAMGEATPLEASGLLAYRCAPAAEPLAAALTDAIRAGALDVPDVPDADEAPRTERQPVLAEAA